MTEECSSQMFKNNVSFHSPEGIALENLSPHVQNFNSSCREFRSSDGRETLYAPYGVPSWMMKEMVPLCEKPEINLSRAEFKLNQQNEMHLQSPASIQHANFGESTVNSYTTVNNENAMWSDSSFGELQTKTKPVFLKKESFFFNTDCYETNVPLAIPKFKFLKKGSRNPFTVVPKNEKKCYRYYSGSDIENQSKNKVLNKKHPDTKFSFMHKSPRNDKEKALTSSGTLTSSNGETTASSCVKKSPLPCTTEKNLMLKENHKKSFASPCRSNYVLTEQEKNAYISSKVKKTDTKSYDTSERMKTDTDGYDRSEIEMAEANTYDTPEVKNTDASVFTKKVASNGCIKQKCSRGIKDILSESESPLKYQESTAYERSCLTLPRLSEVMLGSSSNGYGVMKRRELLMEASQSSATRRTRSVSPRIQSNKKSLMIPWGNTENKDLYLTIAQLQRDSLIRNLRYQRLINRLGNLLYTETLKNRRLEEKYNNLHDVGIQTDQINSSIPRIDIQEEEFTQKFSGVSKENQEAALFENNVFDLKKAWKPFKMELERFETLKYSDPYLFLRSNQYIEVQTANGFIVKCPSRGWNFFFSDNGDVRGENEAGFSYYHFVNDNVYTIEDSSGIVYNCFHDGQLDCVYPDGSVDVRFWENREQEEL